MTEAFRALSSIAKRIGGILVKQRIGLSLAALLLAASAFAADAPKTCDKDHANAAHCQTADCCKKDAACCKDAAKCDKKDHAACKHAEGKDHSCSASCKKS